MYYAQLIGNIVIGVSCLSCEVIADNMKELDDDYTQIVGCGYNNNKFIKTKINAHNLSAITFKWLKFDLELGEYVEDIENTTSFQVDVAGQVVEILVGETLEFTSAELGTFIVKTINEGVGNDSKEVTING